MYKIKLEYCLNQHIFIHVLVGVMQMMRAEGRAHGIVLVEIKKLLEKMLNEKIQGLMKYPHLTKNKTGGISNRRQRCHGKLPFYKKCTRCNVYYNFILHQVFHLTCRKSMKFILFKSYINTLCVHAVNTVKCFRNLIVNLSCFRLRD